MKVLLIHNKYGQFSGEESVVHWQKKILEDNNNEVVTYYKKSDEIDNLNFGKIRAFLAGFHSSKAINELKKIIELEKPDIVHIHNLYPFISPAILPVIKKIGIPIVMTVHNYRLICPNGLFFSKGVICEKCSTNTKELNCILRNCEKDIFKSTGYALRNFWARKRNYFLSNVDTFLCLTEFQKSKLVTNGYPSDKIKVVPNFYNKEISDDNFEIKKGEYVAFVGRVSQEKGISLLFEAADKLPHIPFQLAGHIDDDFKKNLKIPKNITLRGMVEQSELTSFYQDARFLVLPSIWYEGFPMVFPEAMAHKLAIIAPNMAGFPEAILPNINGLLFEPFSASSLADTIDLLWNNSQLSVKLGRNGFKKVQEKYNPKKYYEQLEETYTHLLESKIK